ncbi:TMEM175 family protein [Flavobacterium sp. J27]|uniref:TMEM175 family protein n=1 Tax=Flavobacterium sp. J27 TaxID=2060419 RepID=UPI00102F6641|nr:TMEM175 family protein [Flavobacterium sp. J27]
MKTNRLEAFSDGVLAIIITIMVLELKIPEGNNIESLKPLLPTFTTYVLSYVYIGIYWSNHHHLMQASNAVNGKILWCNLHLLFWISFLPFSTGYMGENHFKEIPTALYGFVLLMSSIAWELLVYSLRKNHSSEALIHKGYATKSKIYFTIIFFILGISMSFISPIIAVCIYVLVSLFWIIPDRTLEKKLTFNNK